MSLPLPAPGRTRTALYTLLAIVAFAANSILARLALGRGGIDPLSFTTLRLAAGAVTLLIVSASTGRGPTERRESWGPAAALFLYAVPFSLAYTRLSTATGALILFGCVQLTMMSAALWTGARPRTLEWCGLGLAIAGLVYLMLPGLATPSATGAGLMAAAGLFWGVFSLQGRRSANPLAQITRSFVLALPFVLITTVAALARLHIERAGALFAVISGSLTSGLGYVVWYYALRGLTAMRAAVVQLAVPVVAATGGVLFMSEVISARLIAAAAMVLGGIALTLFSRATFSDSGSRRVRL